VSCRWTVAAALAGLAACAPSGGGVTALDGATLLDGSGGKPIAGSVILIEAGHITAVGRAGEVDVPSGAVHVDVAGKTIIPGLIDAHAMVERWAAQRYLAWGVTTVRDFGGAGDSAVALKNELGLVTILGPRMFTSGPPIDGDPPFDPRATRVTSGAAARKAVDHLAVVGVDYVAVSSGITPALLRPLMEEAATLRLPVAAHPGQVDALSMARAGAISLEQLAGVVGVAAPDPTPFVRAYERPLAGWTAEETAWGLLDSASVARAARTLAAARVVLVPTLAVHEVLARASDPALLAQRCKTCRRAKPGCVTSPACCAAPVGVRATSRRFAARAYARISSCASSRRPAAPWPPGAAQQARCSSPGRPCTTSWSNSCLPGSRHSRRSAQPPAPPRSCSTPTPSATSLPAPWPISWR